MAPGISKGRAAPPRKPLTQAEVGVKHGFRSGLEEQVSRQLDRAGVEYRYEEVVIKYIRPQREHKYTPDFQLHNGIIVETKGRFLSEDRQKHLLVKAQHPELDIRFVFSRSAERISKQSTTTYAMWAEKYGFKYSDGFIPEEWLNEPAK